jgi:chromosomal replication initiator protein
MRAEVTDATFHIWLSPLELAARDGPALYVRAPSAAIGWVRERYLPIILSAARRAIGADATVEVVEEGWIPAGVATASGSAAARTAAEAEPESARPSQADRGARLNPKYTFDQFVICDDNRLAHAAALTVAELPGQAYNPLFIHGRPGLGKTHLLHAIGNYVQLYGGGLRVSYATVDAFTSAFVDAVRRGEPAEFRERFRSVDVLLIDDVQFLADKAKTAEELFHTFNALHEGGAQIVLTSDREPTEMRDLELRLAERFASGLVAELAPPSFDARLAILRKRARLDALGEVPDDALVTIAGAVTSSVRTLEAALIRVVAYASLTGEEVTSDLARRVLERFRGYAERPASSIERIQHATAEEFGVSPDSLLASDRTPRVAFARQVAMYLARELTGESLPSIGRRFGNRNHSTVLHACRRVEDTLSREGEARETVDNLRTRLGATA